MKLLFDFFPILLFFIAFKMYGIYAATMVAIAASVIQVSISWFRTRKVETMHLVTMVLIVVMGGLTLYLKDEAFIKWKPSVINWLFGVAFIGSQFIGERPIVQRMMGASIELPALIWKRLNMAWALFFILLGFVNWYVMSHYDTETWVNFKLFGMLGLTIAFVFVQAIYLSRYMPETQAETETEE